MATLQRRERDTQLADRDAEASPLSFISDQTVLSLRRGGGRGSKFLGPRFDTSSTNSTPTFGSFISDLPLLRPHGDAPSTFSVKVVPLIPNLCFLDLDFFGSILFIISLKISSALFGK